MTHALNDHNVIGRSKNTSIWKERWKKTLFKQCQFLQISGFNDRIDKKKCTEIA